MTARQPLDQAKNDTRKLLDRSNKLFESAVPTVTWKGAGSYFWSTANGK